MDYNYYDRAHLKEAIVYRPFLYKRRCFMHDNELRAIIYAFEDGSKGISHPGLPIACDLTTLIQRVYIAPTVAPWLEELVRAVVRRYGFVFEVKKSSLREDPLY